MVDEMFSNKSFPPAELDLGTVIVFDDVELADVLSGVEGNFGNNGWVISKKLMNLLSQYNIGLFQAYSLTVKHRASCGFLNSYKKLVSSRLSNFVFANSRFIQSNLETNDKFTTNYKSSNSSLLQ